MITASWLDINILRCHYHSFPYIRLSPCGSPDNQANRKEEVLIVGGKFSLIGSVPATHLGHLLVPHAQNVLHQVVSLADQLHVTILNPVMHHLHKVTSPLVSHLSGQSATRGLQSNRLYKRSLRRLQNSSISHNNMRKQHF